MEFNLFLLEKQLRGIQNSIILQCYRKQNAEYRKQNV